MPPACPALLQKGAAAGAAARAQGKERSCRPLSCIMMHRCMHVRTPPTSSVGARAWAARRVLSHVRVEQVRRYVLPRRPARRGGPLAAAPRVGAARGACVQARRFRPGPSHRASELHSLRRIGARGGARLRGWRVAGRARARGGLRAGGEPRPHRAGHISARPAAAARRGWLPHGTRLVSQAQGGGRETCAGSKATFSRCSAPNTAQPPLQGLC